jgi:predicted amidohydrolase
VIRLALANLIYPPSAQESVALATSAIAEAAGADLIVFPECYVPGYRSDGKSRPAPDPKWLEQAWSEIAKAAARARVAVVLGTERADGDRLLASALVIDRGGARLGFQDKVQLDPSEESTYAPGSGRRVFTVGELTFGVVICHEGWRYPETVRHAVRQGAQLVVHPQFHEAEAGSFRPTRYGDPENSFHEKAVLCRAAENECFFATVNYAGAGSPTTSAIAGPDGKLLAWQPYGRPGLLRVEIDLALATGRLARRWKPIA